ncbi:MAG: hypothetical protein ABI807_05540 [Sporichthyaceae bacterium]
MTTVPDQPDTGLDLIAATITARTAAVLGAPRLATQAARRAAALAERYVIELSPVVARTPQATEAQVTDGITTTGSLCRLLAPAPIEIEEAMA